MKLIKWKTSALLLCWVLLAIILTLINHDKSVMTVPMFGAIVIASAGYLFGTTALFNPLTKSSCENKTDP